MVCRRKAQPVTFRVKCTHKFKDNKSIVLELSGYVTHIVLKCLIDVEVL